MIGRGNKTTVVSLAMRERERERENRLKRGSNLVI